MWVEEEVWHMTCATNFKEICFPTVIAKLLSPLRLRLQSHVIFWVNENIYLNIQHGASRLK